MLLFRSAPPLTVTCLFGCLQGTWNMGRKEGTGTYNNGDGSVYQGDFVNDQYHGNGIMRYANGDVYDGEWECGTCIPTRCGCLGRDHTACLRPTRCSSSLGVPLNSAWSCVIVEVTHTRPWSLCFLVCRLRVRLCAGGDGDAEVRHNERVFRMCGLTAAYV